MSNVNKETTYVPVELQAVWQNKNSINKGYITRISEKDCFIESFAVPDNGENVLIQLKLPSDHWFSLKGTICSVNKDQGFQVLFAELSIDNRLMLTELVSSYGKSDFKLPKLNFAYKKPDKSSRILIADKDKKLLQILGSLVEKQGYEAVAVTDGAKAYNLLSEDNDFAGTMFDTLVPNYKCFDLIRFMKEDDNLKHIPVGVLAEKKDTKLWNQSLDAGVDVFLTKPFDPPQVKMILDIMLNKQFINIV